MRDLEARLTDLEIRYTHQARLVEELDGVVVEQQRLIDRLVAEEIGRASCRERVFVPV